MTPLLQQEITKYEDSLLRFKRKALSQVPFLNDATPEEIDKLVFSMTKRRIEKGDYLIRAGDTTPNIIIIMNGIMDVTCLVNDFEFTVDRLRQGSIINLRTFFLEEPCGVSYKCVFAGEILELNGRLIEKVVGGKQSEMKQMFTLYQKSVLKLNAPPPLDYRSTPKVLGATQNERVAIQAKKEREILFKNIVYSRLKAVQLKRK